MLIERRNVWVGESTAKQTQSTREERKKTFLKITGRQDNLFLADALKKEPITFVKCLQEVCIVELKHYVKLGYACAQCEPTNCARKEKEEEEIK